MLQLLHAGIVAARRQLAALMLFILVLMVAAPITEVFWISATPILTLACLLVSVGLALTTGQAIDLTASRIRSRTRRMRLAASRNVLLALAVQFGLAAALLTILGLRTPPDAITVAAQYFGYASAAPIMWAATMSAGVAFFGARAHATLKASKLDGH